MKRYILTESNEIIDTNILKELKLECVKYNIKVESDNIFDLVEVGNLVEITGFGNRHSLKREVIEGTFGKAIEGCGRLNWADEILAVWKPNKNKGFDLVWEREIELEEE